MVYTKKAFWVRYSLQWDDGISEFMGFILAEDIVDAQQQINQIALDLRADDKIIDVVEEASKFDWDTDMYNIQQQK